MWGKNGRTLLLLLLLPLGRAWPPLGRPTCPTEGNWSVFKEHQDNGCKNSRTQAPRSTGTTSPGRTGQTQHSCLRCRTAPIPPQPNPTRPPLEQDSLEPSRASPTGAKSHSRSAPILPEPNPTGLRPAPELNSLEPSALVPPEPNPTWPNRPSIAWPHQTQQHRSHQQQSQPSPTTPAPHSPGRTAPSARAWPSPA